MNENVKKDAMSTSKYYIMEGLEYIILEAKYTFSRGSVYLVRGRIHLPRTEKN